VWLTLAIFVNNATSGAFSNPNRNTHTSTEVLRDRPQKRGQKQAAAGATACSSNGNGSGRGSSGEEKSSEKMQRNLKIGPEANCDEENTRSR